MASRSVEIVVGLFIALGIGALLVLALQVSTLSMLQEGEGYKVVAYFDNVGGLSEQAPVVAAGVTVGRVVDIAYDERTYSARVTMRIASQYDHFPVDTSASIYTSGLLGEQYVALAAGASAEYLHDGSMIRYTQSAMVLEELISQFLYNKAQGG